MSRSRRKPPPGKQPADHDWKRSSAGRAIAGGLRKPVAMEMLEPLTGLMVGHFFQVATALWVCWWAVGTRGDFLDVSVCLGLPFGIFGACGLAGMVWLPWRTPPGALVSILANLLACALGVLLTVGGLLMLHTDTMNGVWLFVLGMVLTTAYWLLIRVADTVLKQNRRLARYKDKTLSRRAPDPDDTPAEPGWDEVHKR